MPIYQNNYWKLFYYIYVFSLKHFYIVSKKKLLKIAKNTYISPFTIPFAFLMWVTSPLRKKVKLLFKWYRSPITVGYFIIESPGRFIIWEIYLIQILPVLLSALLLQPGEASGHAIWVLY